MALHLSTDMTNSVSVSPSRKRIALAAAHSAPSGPVRGLTAGCSGITLIFVFILVTQLKAKYQKKKMITTILSKKKRCFSIKCIYTGVCVHI